MSGKNPVVVAQAASTTFGSFAEKYEKRTGGAHNIIARQLMCLSAPFTESSRVLDNATGTGIVIEELQNHISATMPDSSIKVNVIAADAAKPMIEYLNAKVERKYTLNAWPNLFVQTHVARAEELDSRLVPDASITHAYMNFGLFFCSDAVRAVSNMHRCLEQGATALITTWRNLSFMSPVHEAHRELYPNEPDFKMPFSKLWEDEEYVIDILTKSGFAKEHIRSTEAVTNMGFRSVNEMASQKTDLFTALVKGAKGWESTNARDEFEAKLTEILLASDGFEDRGKEGVSLNMTATIWLCTKG